MPRLLVTTDQRNHDGATVLLDEHVNSVHLNDDHSAMQLIERVGWAINDAEDAERTQPSQVTRLP